jgi:aldehyde dehydrogenase (NAD+)
LQQQPDAGRVVKVAAEQPVTAVRGGCGVRLCDFSGATAQEVQAAWASRSVKERLKVLRATRHRLAERAEAFAEAISPRLARSKADTLLTEVLPLLGACKFLEREAARLLKPRKLGRSGRPVWLLGVQAEVHREPLGHVLVIGPANFPLLLAGVQTLQALAAGNSVTWKPGVGGAAVATLFAEAMQEAGLPAGLLTITDESVEAAQRALADGPDKVVFTGSSRTGQAVLATLAQTATPAVVELSGADAVVVTPLADLKRVARAVTFGLRLNGGEVCMSPRRLFATAGTLRALRPLLEAELAKVPAVTLDAATSARLNAMLEEAVSAGATVWTADGESLRPTHDDDKTVAMNGAPGGVRPIVVSGATPGMAVTRSDVFAPVISLIEAETMMHVPQMYAQCPYALAVTVFCGKSETRKAMAVARTLKAGTVLINDVIAPTADPRVPFGGRGASGYGVTRGAEGLLEMTAVKTLLVRRGGVMLHLDATTDADAPMFAGVIGVLHGASWSARWKALRRVIGKK